MKKLFSVAILAGGLATRLRPVTETVPKALLKINNEPFINHQLRLLSQHGIRHAVLCVGYLGEMIKDHVGNGQAFDMQIEYSCDGAQLQGTGGAIRHALPLLSENFFVLYGDSYLDCDYASIQTAFEKSHKQGLMTVFHNAGSWDTSNVEYVNKKIISYDKKNLTPRMQYIDYGIGVLTKTAFKSTPEHGVFDLAQLYQSLLKQDELAAYEVRKRFYEVGSFAGIKELEYYLTTQKSVPSLIE